MRKKYRRISPISDKRKAQNEEYIKEKDIFLDEFKKCQVIGCSNKSSEVHHKKGRENKLLLDKKYWMAICRKCHDRIDLSPIWAKVNGYTLKRF